jgi:nitrate/nitrite-specific signal transduction histidine kinase
MSDEGGALLRAQAGHEHGPDGKGFDISETLSESQLGLAVMPERPCLVEGPMTVEASLGSGTTICLSVRLPGPKLVSS